MGSEKSIFQIISNILEKYDIKPIIVGGIALNANKVQRMTFDIDLIITEENYNKIEIEFFKIGYSIFHRQDAFVQLRSSKTVYRDIDFLLSDKKTIDILISNGIKHKIDNKQFHIPSPMHLIEMKLHSISFNRKRIRKDLPDIIQLFKMNEINPNNKIVKQLFKKYKLSDLYMDVKNSIEESYTDEY